MGYITARYIPRITPDRFIMYRSLTEAFPGPHATHGGELPHPLDLGAPTRHELVRTRRPGPKKTPWGYYGCAQYGTVYYSRVYYGRVYYGKVYYGKAYIYGGGILQKTYITAVENSRV